MQKPIAVSEQDSSDFDFIQYLNFRATMLSQPDPAASSSGHIPLELQQIIIVDLLNDTFARQSPIYSTAVRNFTLTCRQYAPFMAKITKTHLDQGREACNVTQRELANVTDYDRVMGRHAVMMNAVSETYLDSEQKLRMVKAWNRGNTLEVLAGGMRQWNKHKRQETWLGVVNDATAFVEGLMVVVDSSTSDIDPRPTSQPNLKRKRE